MYNRNDLLFHNLLMGHTYLPKLNLKPIIQKLFLMKKLTILFQICFLLIVGLASANAQCIIYFEGPGGLNPPGSSFFGTSAQCGVPVTYFISYDGLCHKSCYVNAVNTSIEGGEILSIGPSHMTVIWDCDPCIKGTVAGIEVFSSCMGDHANTFKVSCNYNPIPCDLTWRKVTCCGDECVKVTNDCPVTVCADLEMNLFNAPTVTQSLEIPPNSYLTVCQPHSIGSFTVTQTGCNNYGKTQDKTKGTFPTAIENDLKDEKAFELFPNPTNGNIALEQLKQDFEQDNITITLYDTQWKAVKTFDKDMTNGRTSLELNVPEGLYYLLLQGDDLKEVHKVVVQ